jgi:hypothetical protein
LLSCCKQLFSDGDGAFYRVKRFLLGYSNLLAFGTEYFVSFLDDLAGVIPVLFVYERFDPY